MTPHPTPRPHRVRSEQAPQLAALYGRPVGGGWSPGAGARPRGRALVSRGGARPRGKGLVSRGGARPSGKGLGLVSRARGGAGGGVQGSWGGARLVCVGVVSRGRGVFQGGGV